MAKTFDLKIKELEHEKSELDLSVLQLKKQWYIKKIFEILDSLNNMSDEINAIATLNVIKLCHIKVKEIDQKIENNSKLVREIDKKIDYYQDRREKLKDIPLYRNTKEWIAEIFWWDTVYQYAKETGNEELIEKLKKRTLTSEEYNKILEEDYPEYMENMYSKLFSDLSEKDKEQSSSKPVISLPEWMSEQIKEELKDNKDIRPQDIEKFLKNELKKNAWEIMLSHIKNKFKDKTNQAYEYIRRLIINYPWFKIIDNQGKKITASVKSKNDKLIEEAKQSWSLLKQESYKEKKDMIKMLSEAWETEDVENRCQKYVDLFEKAWCKFSDKQDFLIQLVDAIITQTHIQFDNWIQSVLSGIIQTNLKPEKSRGKWYLSYKLSSSCDARRIIAYPTGEIFTIRPHDVYMEIINKKPPVDKRRK